MKVLVCMEVTDKATEKIVDRVQGVFTRAECKSLNEFIDLYGAMIDFYLSSKLKDNYCEDFYLICLDFFELFDLVGSSFDDGDIPREFKWLG